MNNIDNWRCITKAAAKQCSEAINQNKTQVALSFYDIYKKASNNSDLMRDTIFGAEEIPESLRHIIK